MPPKATATELDLLRAVFKQGGVLDTSSVNWNAVAAELNVPTGSAAYKRWNRFKLALEKPKAGSSGDDNGEGTKDAATKAPEAALAAALKSTQRKKRKVEKMAKEDDEEEKKLIKANASDADEDHKAMV